MTFPVRRCPCEVTALEPPFPQIACPLLCGDHHRPSPERFILQNWNSVLVLHYEEFLFSDLKRHKLIFFKKDFIYLLLERGEGRENEREGNIDWLPLACPQLGTWSATQACALNWASDLLILRLALNPLSHTSRGKFIILLGLQKSEMSLTGLKSRCWQGCISFWMFQERLCLLTFFCLLEVAHILWLTVPFLRLQGHQCCISLTILP